MYSLESITIGIEVLLGSNLFSIWEALTGSEILPCKIKESRREMIRRVQM